MLTLQDIKGPNARSKDKYGFKVPMTSTALDAILRNTLDLPEGDIERIEFDNEYMITTIYYRSNCPETFDGKVKQPCPGRIGQVCEYPARLELKNKTRDRCFKC